MKRILMGYALILMFVSFIPDRSYAQTAEPIVLRFSSFMSPASAHHENYAIWAKEIEEKTAGRVKIDIYPSEALGKAKDHYEMVSTGIVDIAWFTLGFTPGRFPMSSALELPMDIPNSYAISMTTWDIFEKYLQPEFKDVKIVALYANDPYVLFTSRKAVRTLKEIAGLKIRAGVPMHINIARAWGAAAIQLPTSDVYDGLNRGLIDGALFPYSAIKDVRVHEVSKYMTDLKLFSFPFGWGINRKKFDGLPPDIKKIIQDVSGRISVSRGAEIIDTANVQNLETAKKAGLETISLSPKEKQRWLQACNPVVKDSIENLEDKGVPATKIYEEAKLILTKYSTTP